MSVITTIEELRVLAQKRVPRMFYDYADSGSWTESTYRANESDFQKINQALNQQANQQIKQDDKVLAFSNYIDTGFELVMRKSTR